MNRLNRHSAAFRHLFLALFFLANSGFTVVLFHCTMAECPVTQAMPGMSCCSGEHGCTCGMCEESARPQTGTEYPLTVGKQCRTATLAGATVADPTILEKTFSGRLLTNCDCLPVPVLASAITSRPDLSAFHSITPSNISRSSVEKYVLNAAFLI